MPDNRVDEIELPPMELRFMNENDERFRDIGGTNLAVLQEFGLRENSSILDIGCGYGRLAYALNTAMPEFVGKYIGLDILDKHVAWCEEAFSSKSQFFNFQSIDVKNDRYKSGGRASADSYEFSIGDEYCDYVALFSVFTHMYESDIRNYLKEIHRMLKDQALCVATFFTYDDATLQHVNSRDAGITLLHELNGHTRYFSVDDPLHAIAFKRGHLNELISTSGFAIEQSTYGHWAGGSSHHYQDVFVLRKIL